MYLISSSHIQAHTPSKPDSGLQFYTILDHSNFFLCKLYTPVTFLFVRAGFDHTVAYFFFLGDTHAANV